MDSAKPGTVVFYVVGAIPRARVLTHRMQLCRFRRIKCFCAKAWDPVASDKPESIFGDAVC